MGNAQQQRGIGPEPVAAPAPAPAVAPPASDAPTYSGPQGGATDLAYARHYVDDHPPPAAAGAPEGAGEIRPYEFGGFTGMVKRARIIAMQRHREGANIGLSHDRSDGKEMKQRGVTLGPSGATAAVRAAQKTAGDKIVDGQTARIGVGTSGATVAVSKIKDGKETSAGMQVGKNTTMAVSHGNEKRSGSLAVTVGDGRGSVSAGGKLGPVSGKLGYTRTAKVGDGQIGDKGLDATIKDFVGEGSYVERTLGNAGGAGLDVEHGAYGGGASGYLGKTEKVRAFKAGAGASSKALEGVDGFTDVDLARLGRGQGYSFESMKEKGVEGHAKAYVTISLGHDQSELSQTVVARDAGGNLRVMVSQGDASSMGGGIAADKYVSASGKDTKSNMTSVTFTAKADAEGEQAVRAFQETGLLPGADRGAAKVAPDDVAAFEEARKKWQEVRDELADGGTFAYLDADRLSALAADMRAAAGKVNAAFLSGPADLIEGVPGVHYDEHTVARSAAHEAKLSAMGLDVLKSGRTETEYDRGYHDEHGKGRLERGYDQEEEHVIAATERSNIVLDPKGYAKDGDPVAMVVGNDTRVGAERRDRLTKLVPQAFDMPPETLEAWRKGTLHEEDLSTVAVTMTEGQLATIRDRLAPADGGSLLQLRSGVGAYYDEVKRGGGPLTMAGGDQGRAIKLHAQLGKLYEDAARARMLRILATGGALGVDPGATDQLGMKDMLAAVGGVKTAKDFLALTPEEQKLMVTTGAMRSAAMDQSPFEAMRLVLQVKDRNQRNALLRQLYETDERQEEDADAAYDFIAWLKSSGASAGMSKEEMDALLSGVAVRTHDAQRDQAAELRERWEKMAPGTGSVFLGKKLAGDEPARGPVAQSRSEAEADRITDILEASRGDGKDPEAVRATIAAAVEKDPKFLEYMWAALDADPARAAWANYLLEGTPYHRDDGSFFGLR